MCGKSGSRMLCRVLCLRMRLRRVELNLVSRVKLIKRFVRVPKSGCNFGSHACALDMAVFLNLRKHVVFGN